MTQTSLPQSQPESGTPARPASEPRSSMMEKILSSNVVPEASRLMLTGAIIVVAVLAQRRRKN